MLLVLPSSFPILSAVPAAVVALVVLVDFMARCKLSVAFVLRFLLRLMIVTVAGNAWAKLSLCPLSTLRCHALTSHGRRRNRVAVCCMRCLFVSAIPNEARAGAANEQANEPRAHWGSEREREGERRGG